MFISDFFLGILHIYKHMQGQHIIDHSGKFRRTRDEALCVRRKQHNTKRKVTCVPCPIHISFLFKGLYLTAYTNIYLCVRHLHPLSGMTVMFSSQVRNMLLSLGYHVQ